ncbi:hypothetical protein BOQ62_10710 [Chryseobacterium sp. CH21]|uniref:hypothetical protein n=1 Tax=unclassified Chryseobacterium TaxID=2593645 RepID=UPI00100BC906|nr:MULTISPECIES: hypothetical protein [unclassified Chryseobacterium]RXM39635.1 hypothetical protein BOQ62_10710 [Chryseobacterium sp. CH21]UMQ43620.1 hypothetical protein MKS83_07930 [Chryseobacterium sp. Y16C]
MYSENFKALLAEAQFVSDILGTGLTHLGRVNYAKRGYYFTALTTLSTGIERIGKICYLIDFYLNHDFTFPDSRTLRNDIGHDIEKLYDFSKEIVTRNNVKFSYLENLDTGIYPKILKILSKFAKGDRYTNIDFLTNDRYQSSPIADWYNEIEVYIFQNNVSEKKKEKIQRDADLAKLLLGNSSSTFYIDETGTPLEDIGISSFRTGMAEVNTIYRQLYMAQIIRYWVEILSELQNKAHSEKNRDIPFLSEVFTLYYNDDNYLKTRRNFEKIR